jgi:hypothetical protein
MPSATLDTHDRKERMNRRVAHVLRTLGEVASFAALAGGAVMLWLDPAGSGGIVAFCGFILLLYLQTS